MKPLNEGIIKKEKCILYMPFEVEVDGINAGRKGCMVIGFTNGKKISMRESYMKAIQREFQREGI